MARRGANVLRESPEESASKERPPLPRRPRPGEERAAEEVWIREEGTESPAPARRRPRPSHRAAAEPELPGDVVTELTAAVGPDDAARIGERMAAAARAYERDRYPEALRITKGIVDLVPESAAARELHGLVCYRLGRWAQAISHLDVARAIGDDDVSQIPVLMDCHRALRRHRRVKVLFEELRAASPAADVLAEGRMVLASDLADQGRLNEAVEVLVAAGAARSLRHPGTRHLRQWYVLADLYERAGDAAHARELFGRVAAADPELADAAERYAVLGRRPRHRAPASAHGDGPDSRPRRPSRKGR